MAICGYFHPNRTTRSHYGSIGFYLFSRLLVKMVSHQTAQFLKVFLNLSAVHSDRNMVSQTTDASVS